ncbi:Protein SYS1-like protein [Dinothrombium tinctorium]|uniref:Protein SYS1-like protein n=1 Tax=Dinothrombium tinctorium TaxID=1965070 RepID=A0A3S4QPT6_9ACAR|nr:Protein SYS1-like protein [Dinothrombium tinctorium]
MASTTTGQFRHSFWDPILIIAQIFTIQSLFYTSLCFLIVIICALTQYTPSLLYVFGYRVINVTTVFGFFLAFVHLLNTLCGAIYLWFFVQRAKSCLDFSVTTYTFHFIFSTMYNGHFPNTYSWWIVNIICLASMCICGEFLCVRSETKAIPLSQKSDV